MTYADTTSVPVEKSRAEVERTLQRYGASRFGYMTEDGRVVVMFEAHERRIRFDLPMPSPTDRKFTHTEARGHARTAAQAQTAWEQACRQRWRALALVIKAKLEAVEAGITEFEDEFAAFIVLPNGSTVGEWLRPQVAAAYTSGLMPPMMALGPGSA